MLGFQFDIKGIKETLSAVNRTAHALGAEVPAFTLKTLTEAALAKVKELTPGKGRVRSQWTIFNPSSRNAILLNEIVATPEGEMLLKILEGGSKPHKIMPRKPGGVLHFFLRGGEEIFARSVMHPGTKPYAMVAQTEKFLASTMDRLREAALEKLAQYWEN